MPYNLAQGDQQIVIFEDEQKNQSIELEITNTFSTRMKFGWQTGLAPVLTIFPSTGIMESNETRIFEIHFNGEQLPSTSILDTDLALKMWWLPVDNRKRQARESQQEVPIIFAVHVNPRRI